MSKTERNPRGSISSQPQGEPTSPNVVTTPTFEIISFLDNPSGSPIGGGIRPHSVRRLSDGEVFSLQDRVSNGPMTGMITEFSLCDHHIFVVTTWSSVGIDLESIWKIPLLPSRYQYGDPVRANFFGVVFPICWIKKIHFSESKVMYDLQVLISYQGKAEYFRLYNVDSVFVEDQTLPGAGKLAI